MVLVLFLIGIIVGIVSPLIGIGGGIFMVPIIYFFFPTLPSANVIATSLAVVLANSLINVWCFFIIKKVPRLSFGVTLGIFAAIGMLIGFEFVTFLSNNYAKRLFSAILLLVIFLQIIKNKKNINRESSNEWTVNYFKTAPIGFLGGLVGGLTGLGGGIIFIPFMLHFLNVPTILLSAYSNMAMSIGIGITLFNQVFKYQTTFEIFDFPHHFLGPIDLTVMIILFVGSLFGILAGQRLHSKLKPKIIFIISIVITAVVAFKTFITSFS